MNNQIQKKFFKFRMFFFVFVYIFSSIGTQAYAKDLAPISDQSLLNRYEQQVRSVQENLTPEDLTSTPELKDTSDKDQNPISELKDLDIENLQTQQDYVEGEVLVKYKNNKINLSTLSGRTKALDFINSKSLEKKEDLRKINISILAIKDDKTVEEKIAELKKDPNVEYAQPNFQYYTTDINTNDTNKSLLWGLDNTGQTINGIYGNIAGTNDKDIDAPESWAINEGTNSSVIVAIIDSGVAYNHPDLVANMWDGLNCKDENGNALGSCNHGYDYEDNDKTPLPTTSSHGTHIAGTIGAIKNNSKGVIGVAPNVKIMAIKSSLTTAEIIKGINFAKQNGAKIINASWACLGGDWGGTHPTCGGDGDYRDQAIINAIDGFQGLFVTAAGNGNGDEDSEGDNHDGGETHHSYPCDHTSSNIICVAATDQNDNLASFSDYGSTSVDVGAPGTNIYSTISDSSVMSENFNGVTAPNLPSGWTKTGDWGTFDYSSDKVLYGDYSHAPYLDNIDSIAVSPKYNLGGNTGVMMSFFTQCDTEYYTPGTSDYMALELSSDGTNFTQFIYWNETDLDSLNGDSDSSGSAWYYIEKLSLPSQYLTSNFKFRFKWHTDSSNVPIQNYDGCFIDDINITKYSDGSDEKYGYSDGTSMATPHVVGLAALVWGYKPELTYSQVKDTILNTGDSVASLSGKTVSGKRINAFNALNSLAPATHTISGTIKYYDGVKAIPSATVTLEDAVGVQLATTTTDVNGIYQFTGVTHGGNYVVKVNKIDEVASNGVDVLDLTKTRRQITEIEIFDQIFKKIAADVNNDLLINILDLTKIRRYIAEIAVLPSGGWKFYPSDAILDETNYLTAGQTRTYANLTADTSNQDFIGVKMGDVNKSWTNN